MNVEWEFLRDFWFYCLVGLIAAVPVAAFVAAVAKSPYSEAMSRTKYFLTEWASFGGDAAWNLAIQGAAKVGGVVILLALLAWGLSRLGDYTLPHVSTAFKHFGRERVGWSITYEGEWNELRYQYREITGIKKDLIKWEEAKARLGSHAYRFFRTLFWLALIVAGAGVIDLLRRFAFPRGTLELVLGLVVAVGAAALWVDRNDRFIRNLVSEYRDVHKEKTGYEPILPAHYPKAEGPQGSPASNLRFNADALQAAQNARHLQGAG